MTQLNKEHKSDRYKRLISQLTELFTVTPDTISRMATAAALLYHKMGHFYWVGFYRHIDDQLLVGPYQGTMACQKLKSHTGVCWTGVDRNQTIVVPDVHAFAGHIACDPKSQSEIVVPVRNASGSVIAVLDGDSDHKDMFDEVDARFLEQIAGLIAVRSSERKVDSE